MAHEKLLQGRGLEGGPGKGARKETDPGHGGVMNEKRRLDAWTWEEAVAMRSQKESTRHS